MACTQTVFFVPMAIEAKEASDFGQSCSLPMKMNVVLACQMLLKKVKDMPLSLHIGNYKKQGYTRCLQVNRAAGNEYLLLVLIRELV